MLNKTTFALIVLAASTVLALEATDIAPREIRMPSDLWMWDRADGPIVPYWGKINCTAASLGTRACGHSGNGIFACTKNNDESAKPVWVLDSKATECTNKCCESNTIGETLKCTIDVLEFNESKYCPMGLSID